MSDLLPRRTRVGYGLGSVATGTFGTVPGLMLLPYLTDTLGVAAAVAGLIVLLPKAWDVVLNPVAGRISDRTVDPRGPRRPFLLRAGLLLAACFALLFAGPDLGSTVLDALWVLVLFVGCATAYAFFQVPYVAMPAEITDSYAERTRLMTWRVAILAFAILLSGASAPAIRNAFDGRDGYRVMGLVVAVILVIGVVGAYRGTAGAPVGRATAGEGTLREQLRVVAEARDFRLLLTTFVLQALATSQSADPAISRRSGGFFGASLLGVDAQESDWALCRRTDLWRAWVGFNFSHSLGAVLFGLAVVLVARTPAAFEANAEVFLPFALAVSLTYLGLGLLYWFRTPIAGLAISTGCFAAAWLLRLMS